MILGSLPRAGPPTWQSGPPGPQFRPYVPGQHPGPPKTLADRCLNSVSSVPVRPPLAYRPGGNPVGFQPFQTAPLVPGPPPPFFARPPPPGGPPMAGPPGARPPSLSASPNFASVGSAGHTNSPGSPRFRPGGGAGRPHQESGYGPLASFPTYPGPPLPPGALSPPSSTMPLFTSPSQAPPPLGSRFGQPPQPLVSAGQQ